MGLPPMSPGGPLDLTPDGTWMDHKFTKQGASMNEIYNKLVPFFTQKTDATGEYPPGQVLLLGCAAWIGFMFLMGAWVVRVCTPARPNGRAPLLSNNRARARSLNLSRQGSHSVCGAFAQPPAAARSLNCEADTARLCRCTQWFCPHNPFTMMMGGDGGGPERPRAAAKWRKPIKNH
jgi:hypothetical protein